MKLTELPDFVVPEEELPRIFWLSALRKTVIYIQAAPVFLLTAAVAYYFPGRGALGAWKYAISEPSEGIRVYILKLIPVDFLFPALLALFLLVISAFLAFLPLLVARAKVSEGNTCDVERTSCTLKGKLFVYSACQFLLDQRCQLTCVSEDGKIRKTTRPYEYKNGNSLIATVAYMAYRSKTLESDTLPEILWQGK